MPADLSNPFGPSCCEGGACNSNDMSAQSCGCDKGANWICERHRVSESLRDKVLESAELAHDLMKEAWGPQPARDPLLGEIAKTSYPEDLGAAWFDVPLHYEKVEGKKIGKLKTHLNEVVNKTWNFAGRIKDEQGHQQNALIGLASEAGELLDVGKKLWFHSEKANGYWREKMLSELGDIFYYLLKIMDVFGFTLKEVLEYNRKKLSSRHPELGQVTERFGKDAIKG